MIEKNPTYDTNARKNLVLSEIKDLYRYKALLLHLILRNITSRYKRSILGIAWTLLDPLATMLIMAVIFSSVFGHAIKAYPLFLLSALVIWNFIMQASTGAITDLLGGNWLLGKVYMPKTVFALTSLGANLINLGFAIIPLTLLFLYYRMPVTLALLFIPVAIFIIALFTLGVGLLVSAFSVFFADMLNIHTIALRLLMYLSGVFYLVDNLPEIYRPVIRANPIYSLIALFRDPLYFGTLPRPWDIAYGTVWALGFCVFGLLVFLRLSDQITYRI
jgi:ABC-2 type transport system permease protein